LVSILFALKGKTKENAEVKKEATLKTDLALSNQHVRTPSKTQLQFPIGAMPGGY
jgi:hypothetical protein